MHVHITRFARDRWTLRPLLGVAAVTDRLLTAREVADRLLISTETALRWYRRGELPGFPLPGGGIRFREDADPELDRRAGDQQQRKEDDGGGVRAVRGNQNAPREPCSGPGAPTLQEVDMQSNSSHRTDTDPLEHYTRQAELSGAPVAWELAQADRLTPTDLGRLAARLRSLDPVARRDARGYRIETARRFRLKPRERKQLAISLIGDGVKDTQIVMWTGISRTTLWRVHQDRQNGGPPPLPEPASGAGLRVSERPNPT